jgi:hypothetical protein
MRAVTLGLLANAISFEGFWTELTAPKAEPSSYRALLLVGETKAGKSTTGNTLLGGTRADVFPTSARAASVTQHIQLAKTSSPSGEVWRVLDSPGFHDTFIGDESDVDSRLRFGKVSPRGLDVLLFVLPCSRVTRVEQSQLARVQQLFPNATEYLAVAFTHCRDNGTAFRLDMAACAAAAESRRGSAVLKEPFCLLHQHVQGRVVLFPSLETRAADRRDAFALFDGMASRRGVRPYATEEFDRARERRDKLYHRLGRLGWPRALSVDW